MSEQTSRVLALARREAHAQVSSGHLLLGALHPDGGDVLRRLALSVDLGQIRNQVRELTAGPSDPHARLSERVKRVLVAHASVRDVLAALLDDPESTAVRVLSAVGQDLTELRAKVRAMPDDEPVARTRRKATKVARPLKYGPPPAGQLD